MILAYESRGGGVPLLLMMGINASRAAWEPHVSAWTRSFRCILVDNPGVGQSPPRGGDYSCGDVADDFAEVLDDAGLDQAHVVGISMGAAVAQQFALRHPERASSLVLTAGWAAPDLYLRSNLETISRTRRSLPYDQYTEYLHTLIWTPERFVTHAAELSRDRAAGPAVDADVLDGQIAACMAHDVVAELPQLAVRTLVTAGTEDRFVPLGLSVAVSEAIEGSVLSTFAGSGHAHHFEDPVTYNALVADWITS